VHAHASLPACARLPLLSCTDAPAPVLPAPPPGAADWEDDLSQLCAAMPFMVGCTLWEQCINGTASGPYCALPSLVGATCADMPLVRSLCGGATLLCRHFARAGLAASLLHLPRPLSALLTCR
jgi:hypothetical protein